MSVIGAPAGCAGAAMMGCWGAIMGCWGAATIMGAMPGCAGGGT
eukprot:COSAG04_NODE_1817_length_5502_cov_13.905053_4_plen_44_part_00